MSLDFTLYLASTRTPEQVLLAIANENGLVSAAQNKVGRGVVVSAGPVHPVTRAMVEDCYQFAPTVSLLFTVDKFEKRDTGMEFVVFGSIRLVEQERSLALLNSSHDGVLFTWKNGLRANRNSLFWTPGRIAKIDVPYVLESLPDLE
ncbi:MAG: hypothetical protein KF708_00790 [Pirellulales bacterium]|nr:hypothetical protein [Pirellulales bacterium]